MGDEELGATPQDVEDRLRDGEAPEAGDVDRVEAARARGGPSGLLRVHVGQPLPIRHTVQMLSDARASPTGSAVPRSASAPRRRCDARAD